MDYWSALTRDATHIEKQTNAGCTTEVTLLKDAFNLYADAFVAIPTTGTGPALAARLAILSQALNSFRVMVSSSLQGFYLQALIPLRHAFEGWLSFWYLAKHPEDAERWINPTWQMRPPKVETMVNKMDHPAKLMKSRIRDFHDELNRFAHIDPVAILSRLHQEEDKTYVGVGIRYSPHHFQSCSYGMLISLGNYLDAASSIIPPGSQWHQQYPAVEARILRFLGSQAPPEPPPSSPPAETDAA